MQGPNNISPLSNPLRKVFVFYWLLLVLFFFYFDLFKVNVEQKEVEELVIKL